MVKVGSMKRAMHVLLVASFISLAATGGFAWPHRSSTAKPAGDSSAAASVLASVEVGSNPARLILRTSGTPAYTSYSPTPDIFVIDLSGVSKAATLSIPHDLPAGVASVTADEAVEMGNRLTRVTLRFAEAQTPRVSASDHDVMVDLSGAEVRPAAAENAAPPVVPAPTISRAAETVVEAPLAPAADPGPRVDSAIPLPSVASSETAVVSHDDVEVPLTAARVLTAVQTSGSGKTLQVHLSSDGAVHYKVFQLDKPARIVIDLSGVRDALRQNIVDLGDPFVRKIRIAQFKSGADPVTRVVLDLDEKVEYNVAPRGSGLDVTFGSAVRAAPTAASRPEPIRVVEAVRADLPPPAPLAVADIPSTSVTTAAIRPAAQDLPAQVPVIVPDAVTTSDWKMPSDPTHGATHIITAQTSPTAPASPARRSTSAAQAAATMSGNTTAPSDDVFNDPQQAATINNGKQLSGAGSGNGRSIGAGNARVFNGEPISLNLKGADLKDVLRTFAQLTGLNVAVDPGVVGEVTVEFNEVPWDQALDIILRQNGLTYVLEGNVMRIGRQEIIAREAEATSALAEKEKLNVPLLTVSYKLSYARASDVETLLKQIASPRAKIIVDARTNQIVISEIGQYLPTEKNLIDSVDVPTPQVLIEARIIETTKTFLQQYGVSFGFNGTLNPSLGSGTGLTFPNSISLQGGRFDFATGNPLITATLSNVLGTFDLDFTLAAAESEGLVKIISAPKVTTQDNVAASIESGVSIPYQTTVTSGAILTTTTVFVDATLRLSVTPQITEQGTVIMDITVQKVDPGVASAGAAPSLTTRRASTKLMVRDGGTAVIGGIYQSTDSNAQNRVPFLSDIPVLGNLFKNHNVNSTHDELLIFITPRIIRNS
jgi:type IV pilus assembly protein PilQ